MFSGFYVFLLFFATSVHPFKAVTFSLLSARSWYLYNSSYAVCLNYPTIARHQGRAQATRLFVKQPRRDGFYLRSSPLPVYTFVVEKIVQLVRASSFPSFPIILVKMISPRFSSGISASTNAFVNYNRINWFERSFFEIFTKFSLRFGVSLCKNLSGPENEIKVSLPRYSLLTYRATNRREAWTISESTARISLQNLKE